MAQVKEKSAYEVLQNQYYSLIGGIRKHFTGNGRNTESAAAEAIITGCTVRVEGSNAIFYKDTVAKLRAVYLELTATDAPSLADVI